MVDHELLRHGHGLFLFLLILLIVAGVEDLLPSRNDLIGVQRVAYLHIGRNTPVIVEQGIKVVRALVGTDQNVVLARAAAGKVRGDLFQFRIPLDAAQSQAFLDHFALGLVRGNVRRIEFKAVGIAGFRQQFLRSLYVHRPVHIDLGIGPGPRGDQRLARGASACVAQIVQRLRIDQQPDGLADTLIPQGAVRMIRVVRVQQDAAGQSGIQIIRGNSVAALILGAHRCRDVGGHIRVAALHRHRAGGRIADEHELDVLVVRHVVLVPVVLVALEKDVLARDPLFEDELAGADGNVGIRNEQLIIGIAQLLQRLLRIDSAASSHQGFLRAVYVCIDESDLDGLIIDGLDLVHIEDGRAAAEVDPEDHGVGHVLRGDRIAVGEFDAVAKRDPIVLFIFPFQGLGQGRNAVSGLYIVLIEMLVHAVGDIRRRVSGAAGVRHDERRFRLDRDRQGLVFGDRLHHVLVFAGDHIRRLLGRSSGAALRVRGCRLGRRRLTASAGCQRQHHHQAQKNAQCSFHLVPPV